MESGTELRRVFRTTAIINGALVASLFLYVVIAELVRSQLRPYSGLVRGLRLQPVRYVFFAAAVGAVVFVRLASRSLGKVIPGEDVHEVILRLGRATVFTASLGELPAMLGFILFLLTGFSRDFYLLLFVSLFLEFIYFPRLRVWREMIRERFPQARI